MKNDGTYPEAEEKPFQLDERTTAMIDAMTGTWGSPEKVVAQAVDLMFHAPNKNTHCILCPYGGTARDEDRTPRS